MPLVAVVEESRTRPPMPRQKNVCCGHDCSGIVGSQKLLHKNLFRKVPLFVKCKVQIFISQSTDFHFAKYRLHFAKYRFSFRKVQIFILQSTDFISFHFISQSTISRKKKKSEIPRPSGQKFENLRTSQRSTSKRDFETHSKRLPDFEIGMQIF